MYVMQPNNRSIMGVGPSGPIARLQPFNERFKHLVYGRSGSDSGAHMIGIPLAAPLMDIIIAYCYTTQLF